MISRIRTSNLVIFGVIALTVCCTSVEAFPGHFILDKAQNILHEAAASVKKLAELAMPKEFEAVSQYPYQAPTADAVRGPCPALNTLANHGYINRKGYGITQVELVRALVQRLGVSTIIGNVLALGAFSNARVVPPADVKLLNLSRLSTHNEIEHDASLAHLDADTSGNKQDKFNAARLEKLKSFGAGGVLTMDGVAHARVFFTNDSFVNNPKFKWTAQLKFNAEGEAIVLTNVLGRNKKISFSYLDSFLEKEQFPDDWTKADFGVTDITKDLIELHASISKYEKQDGVNVPVPYPKP